MIRHLLTGEEMKGADFERLMELSKAMKADRYTARQPRPFEGKSVGMIFAKSSTRTRVSFEVGIHELGGHAVYLDEGKTQMGRGETIPDTARVLSRYLSGIVIRTYSQAEVEQLAEYASCPIINALTDDYHPCQALTDLFTIYEKKGTFKGIKMAYLGDGASNMANSLMQVSKIAGIHFEIGAPEEYRPSQRIMDQDLGSGTVTWTKDPAEAMKDADFVYTDVWVSMGFEKESQDRMKILEPYRLDMNMLNRGKPGCMVMHCLPAHRGEEITDEVMESSNAIVFDEAENRLHVQKAIMSMLVAD